MKKYILIFISFILILIGIDSAFAMSSGFWGAGSGILHPVDVDITDCNSSACDVSLNPASRAPNSNNGIYYYYNLTNTYMSSNGNGVMWVYQLNNFFKSGYLYSLTTYICHNSSSDIVYKGIYTNTNMSAVKNFQGSPTVYQSLYLSSLDLEPFSGHTFQKCGFVNTIIKPNNNSKFVGIRSTVNSNSSNYVSYLIGYSVDPLGSAEGLSSSDIQNVINNSGLATASDINGVNNGISNIQSSLTNARDNINNNIDEAETNINDNTNRGINSVNDNLHQESENIQNGIKEGFEDCRDSFNLLDFTSFLTSSSSSYTLSDGLYTINSYGSALTKKSINLSHDTTYTLSQKYKPQGLVNLRIEILEDSTVIATSYATNQSSTTVSFTTGSSGSYYVRLNFSSGSLPAYIDKPILNLGSSAKTYEPYGEEICKNRIDTTNDKLDDVNNSLNNSDVNGATGDASSFFSGFTTNTFGLTSIITSPLNLINSLTSKTCTPLTLQIPYVNMTMQLPCMSTIYNEHFSTFMTIYQTITFGITSYWVCVRIFALVKDFKNPDHDEIEVMDL